MTAESIIVIVGRGAELDRAIDAQTETGMRVKRFATAAAAAQMLPSLLPRRIGAVLVSLLHEAEEGLDLMAQLREDSRLHDVPVTVWAPANAEWLLGEAYAHGANSALLLTGGEGDALALSQTIHYWKAINESRGHGDTSRAPEGVS